MTTDETPHSTVSALQSQVRLVSILLDGLELGAERVRLVGLDQLNPISGTANGGSVRVVKPASYGGIDEKRVVLRFATEHLATGLASDIDQISLPSGSPFGSVQVDAQTCTLCMGCVSVCPAGAIGDDKAKPRLTFVESNCVQCGICQQACPEDSISLVPRLLLDSEHRMHHQTLNEEAPFCCIDCGKPFTTQSMISKMEEKLSGHRMFQGNALKTLHRCEDCRVKVMF
jgi:ferredoxin